MKYQLYANCLGYSDVEPHEVVEIRTPNKMLIRAMDATIDPTWKMDFTPGGFFGHVHNDRSQRWIITPNPDAPIIAIRKHKNDRWYDRWGNRYAVSEQARKFHDHNF